MSVFFNFEEIEKCNSIVPKGHRNYSFFSFKSSIFIKTRETLRRCAPPPFCGREAFGSFAVVAPHPPFGHLMLRLPFPAA